MRANRWPVYWRIAPGARFEQQSAPYASRTGAGIILLGEQPGQPGARAEDYLAGVATDAPVASPAAPYIADVRRSNPAEHAVYAQLSDSLFIRPGAVGGESKL